MEISLSAPAEIFIWRKNEEIYQNFAGINCGSSGYCGNHAEA